MERGVLMAGCGRGFCSIRRWLSACRAPNGAIPRLLVLKLHLVSMLCPKCRPPRSKTLKTGRSGRGRLRFGLNGAGHGARGWAGAPVGKRAHERIRVWAWGHVCGAAEWVFVKAPCRGHNKSPEA